MSNISNKDTGGSNTVEDFAAAGDGSITHNGLDSQTDSIQLSPEAAEYEGAVMLDLPGAEPPLFVVPIEHIFPDITMAELEYRLNKLFPSALEFTQKSK